MPKCLTHNEVEKRFLVDLQALCELHHIQMSSLEPIYVSVPPVYNTETNLYESYGSNFKIGVSFPTPPLAKKDYLTIPRDSFPDHQRG